ncbi:MAG: sec-independent protein translocase protein TatA [Alphaproteobacteria bacterium]|nr:MAG: sec-independent protein translocase protein TatA [Caulobacteraceae bacterium]TPW07038.1 MAG: sec-independent protein translocase protein TatA [Alphaproteobacteria bacterium]
MHLPGLIPLLIVLALAFLLFGRPGRISNIMEDLGKGIRGFKKGLGDPDAPPPAAEPPAQLRDQTPRKDDERTGA